MKSPVLKKVVRNHRQTAKTSVNQSGGCADNRPAANLQRKLQQSADNSQQVQTAAQLQKSADTAARRNCGLPAVSNCSSARRDSTRRQACCCGAPRPI